MLVILQKYPYVPSFHSLYLGHVTTKKKPIDPLKCWTTLVEKGHTVLPIGLEFTMTYKKCDGECSVSMFDLKYNRSGKEVM